MMIAKTTKIDKTPHFKGAIRK